MSESTGKRTTISKDKLAEYAWVERTFKAMCDRLQNVVQASSLQFKGGGTVDGDLIAGFHESRAELETTTADLNAAHTMLADARAALAERDARLAAIAFRARTAIDDLDADGVDDLNALLDIESVASGEPRKNE